MRAYGPRAQIRITTLEQTLLDSLYKPFHCGGPEVVFEAWQEGVASGRIDEERLVKYLRSMNYPATTRRVAVMLELAGGNPSAELRQFLQASQKAIDRQSPHACISLLPGVDYQNLNESWLVSTP
jgi:predicted transcriptional regulator of viral defense system